MLGSSGFLYQTSGGVGVVGLFEEITCVALRNLRNAGGLEVGKTYVVTDYNRGTVGAARIETVAVSTDSIGTLVSVHTVFDDEAWAGWFNLDDCRLRAMHDNLGNEISSDNGDEIDVFPWGNGQVSGNIFEDLDFNYSGGIVRDNRGGPGGRLDVSDDASVTFLTIHSGGDLRASGDSSALRSTVGNNARVSISGSGSVQDSQISGDSDFSSNAVGLFDSSITDDSSVLTDGSTGRIDQLTVNSGGSVDTRDAGELNIDNVEITSRGRALLNAAGDVTMNAVTISTYGFIQGTVGSGVDVTETTVSDLGRVRSLAGGSLMVDRCGVHASGIIDSNTTGSNTIRYCQVTSGGGAYFLNETDNNRIEWHDISSLAVVRFLGTSTGGIVDRGSSRANSRVDVQDTNDVIVRQCGLETISWLIIRGGSNGFQCLHSSFNGYGRMLVENSSGGRVLGTTVTGGAYVRLREHSSDLRYSTFNAYHYYYLTGNTAVKQGLHTFGRETYTEPVTGTITGTPERNWP